MKNFNKDAFLADVAGRGCRPSDWVEIRFTRANVLKNNRKLGHTVLQKVYSPQYLMSSYAHGDDTLFITILFIIRMHNFLLNFDILNFPKF